MCVNFITPSHQQLKTHFKAPIAASAEWKTAVWQDYAAPIIVGDEHERQSLLGLYSMIPKSHLPPGTKRFSTMNARAETVATLRSYAQPWRDGQLCLVPMTTFFEPCYESGKAERWKIGMADESPFAVAGLYRSWTETDGGTSFSFTQLTINADEHPLMRRFHKPGDEKRSLVILPESAYGDWLGCRDSERAKAFLKHSSNEHLVAYPVPKVAISKPKSTSNLGLFN
ncbi:hypothetical protein S2091_2196 [Solimicrobium silvestre]|uniref:Abasic site processing protein n=2 Tax=Solimicrobium silvestre TaxID=2099400 RepID=A0A2S9GZI0_9BURK|nr:hypothetical protein S2091_2196 [Solimicrobium silvestre]